MENQNGFHEIELVEITSKPEVGETVAIELPGAGTITATWLGTTNGKTWSFTDACRLMVQIDDERKAQRE